MAPATRTPRQTSAKTPGATRSGSVPSRARWGCGGTHAVEAISAVATRDSAAIGVPGR